MKHNFGNQSARDYCKRFPNAGTKTIARMLHRDQPQLFPTFERARNAVRYLRGQRGKQLRKQVVGMMAAPQNVPSGFEPLPPGITTLEWNVKQVEGPCKVLVLADVHVPYHDLDALNIAMAHGRKLGVDTILLNGDLSDHYGISRWEPDPRLRDWPGEVQTVRLFLRHLRHQFRKCRILWKEGNHEERYTRYMRTVAPALLGLDKFEPQEVYELGQTGIEYYAQRRPLRLGKLTVIHGSEYSFPISNPVNPARGLFMRAKANALCSHFHQSSHHSERTIKDETVSTWSTGCLCDLHPEYRPLNNWGHGFAVVDVDKSGAFDVSNLRIVHGKVY